MLKAQQAYKKMSTMASVPPLQERYRAAMVLSGVGDALGYKNGEWEFCDSGKSIHDQLERLGGLSSLKVRLPDWMISDDTVMHLATGEALLEASSEDHNRLFSVMAQKYIDCMEDMCGRSPGMTCMSCVHVNPLVEKGYQIPYNPRGGGCGAAMRAMCIGLRYPRPEDLDSLIAVSIESGRLSHHHPTGYLGSLASALFTAYSIQGKQPREWGHGLMSTLPKALDYVRSANHCVEENECDWWYFTEQWEKYLTERQILSGNTDPKFPMHYDISDRDKFYNSVSYGGWGGASGHDAPMIAYDAILSAGKNWDELCSRSMFHCGDSDSTGVIAACCYGAMYGFHGVHACNYENVEYRGRLETVADALFNLAYPDEMKKSGRSKKDSHAKSQSKVKCPSETKDQESKADCRDKNETESQDTASSQSERKNQQSVSEGQENANMSNESQDTNSQSQRKNQQSVSEGQENVNMSNESQDIASSQSERKNQQSVSEGQENANMSTESENIAISQSEKKN